MFPYGLFPYRRQSGAAGAQSMPASSPSLHEAAAQCDLDHLARPEEGLGRPRAPTALQAPLLSSMHPRIALN